MPLDVILSRRAWERGHTIENGQRRRWADYGVYKVQYDRGAHRIVKALIVPQPYYTSNGERQTMTRGEMIEALREGKTFAVVIKHGNMWRRGADMSLMEIEGEPYIRAHSTRVPMDSREQIPEFRSGR